MQAGSYITVNIGLRKMTFAEPKMLQKGHLTEGISASAAVMPKEP